MEKIKIDPHVHLNISPNIKTTEEYALFKDREIKKVCKARGIDGVVYTDHMHHPYFWKTQKLIPYNKSDLVRISGAEITTNKKKDVLVFGSLGELRKLDESFHEKLSSGFFPKLENLYEKVRELDLPIASAHHFRKVKDFSDREYDRFDALELDIRNTRNVEKIRKTASDHGLSIIAGSDAHTPYSVGIAWTEFKDLDSFEFESCKAKGIKPNKRTEIYRKCKETRDKIKEVRQMVPMDQ